MIKALRVVMIVWAIILILTGLRFLFVPAIDVQLSGVKFNTLFLSTLFITG
jgi:hypothetical protein